MSLHRITISFKDAGLFQRPRTKGAEQIMLTPVGPVNREDAHSYADTPWDTLLNTSVANMFRVLLGYRPVPTFRGATQAHKDASQCQMAVELAAKSYVQITSGLTTSKEGAVYPTREIQMTSKANDNSWAKADIPWEGPEALTYRVSWLSVASEFGRSDFQDFQAVVTSMLGPEALDRDMVTVFGELYKAADNLPLVKFFSEHKISKYYSDALLHGKTSGQYFGHSGQHDGIKHWHWRLIGRGINDSVSRRSGTITVDVTSEEWAALKAGPTMATLLDGGFAEITNKTTADEDIDIPGVHTFDHEEI